MMWSARQLQYGILRRRNRGGTFKTKDPVARLPYLQKKDTMGGFSFFVVALPGSRRHCNCSWDLNILQHPPLEYFCKNIHQTRTAGQEIARPCRKHDARVSPCLVAVWKCLLHPEKNQPKTSKLKICFETKETRHTLLLYTIINILWLSHSTGTI